MVLEFLHIIKWVYQPHKRSSGWVDDMITHRNNALKFNAKHMKEIFKDKNKLQKIYLESLEGANSQTNREYDTVPPIEIPDFLLDPDLILYNDDKLYNFLISDLRETLFISNAKVYNTIYKRRK